MTAEKQIIEGTFKVGNKEHFNNCESKNGIWFVFNILKIEPK